MPKKVEVLLLVYVLGVLFHSTDLNPIMLWDWYREATWGWIEQHPGFWMPNILLALILSAFMSAHLEAQEKAISTRRVK